MRHEHTITTLEARLAASFQIDKTFGLELRVPVRGIDTEVLYRDPLTDQPIALLEGGERQQETFIGLVDPWLMGTARRRLGGVNLRLSLGATIPIGSESEDAALGESDLESQNIRLGSGVIAPIIGVDASKRVNSVNLSAFALTVQHLYRDSDDDLLGDRYVLGGRASTSFGLEKMTFGLGANIFHETAEDRADGGGLAGNRGRTDLTAAIEISRRLSKMLEARVALNVPVYSRIVGRQLDVVGIIEVGITSRFELGGGQGSGHSDDDGHDHGDEDGHDHGDEDGHDHGDKHDHGDGKHDATIDIATAGHFGEAPELTPVAGKITVYDFWATWCAPCAELERGLIELAKRHPGEIAIRKVNVVDWKSEAAKKYLVPGGHNLPHLVVFGRDGNQLFKLSAEPDVLLKRVREALDKHP